MTKYDPAGPSPYACILFIEDYYVAADDEDDKEDCAELCVCVCVCVEGGGGIAACKHCETGL